MSPGGSRSNEAKRATWPVWLVVYLPSFIEARHRHHHGVDGVDGRACARSGGPCTRGRGALTAGSDPGDSYGTGTAPRWISFSGYSRSSLFVHHGAPLDPRNSPVYLAPNGPLSTGRRAATHTSVARTDAERDAERDAEHPQPGQKWTGIREGQGRPHQHRLDRSAPQSA